MPKPTPAPTPGSPPEPPPVGWVERSETHRSAAIPPSENAPGSSPGSSPGTAPAPGAAPAPGSRAAKRARSQHAILHAAVAEYAERGRAGVRIERVAKRAGVNKALIYRYFTDRDGLFDAALHAVFTGRFALLESLPDELPDLLTLWAGRFAADPLFLRMLMREALEQTPGRRPAHAAPRRRYYAQQARQVRRLQEQGRLPADADPRDLMLALTALVAFPYVLPQVAALITGAAPGKATFDRRWQNLLRQLAHALANPPDAVPPEANSPYADSPEPDPPGDAPPKAAGGRA